MTARTRIAATAFGVLAAVAPAPAEAYDVDVLVLAGSGEVDPGFDVTPQPQTLSINAVATGFGNHGIGASYACTFVVQETVGTLAAGSGTAQGSCGYVWCRDSVSARSGMTLTLTCAPPSPTSGSTTNGTMTCTLTPKSTPPVTAVDVQCQGWATQVP